MPGARLERVYVAVAVCRSCHQHANQDKGEDGSPGRRADNIRRKTEPPPPLKHHCRFSAPVIYNASTRAVVIDRQYGLRAVPVPVPAAAEAGPSACLINPRIIPCMGVSPYTCLVTSCQLSHFSRSSPVCVCANTNEEPYGVWHAGCNGPIFLVFLPGVVGRDTVSTTAALVPVTHDASTRAVAI